VEVLGLTRGRGELSLRGGRRLTLSAAACLLLLVAGSTGRASDVGTSTSLSGGVPADASSAAADDLLLRLKSSDRIDLVGNPNLKDAGVGEGLIVHRYPDLEPIYCLYPIRGSESEVVGVIAVDAQTRAWCWYTFGYHGSEFPRVGSEAAARRAAGRAAALGIDLDSDPPMAVAMPDKRVGWLLTGRGEGDVQSLVVDLDDPNLPLLSTIDGTLQRSLVPDARPERDVRPPADRASRGLRRSDSRPPGGTAGPRTRPAISNIPDVPFHFQITSWYCGCASVQMLLDHYGPQIGQDDISDVEDDVPGSGTGTSGNRRACHFSGMSAAVQNPNLLGYRERSLGYVGNEAYLSDDPLNELKDVIAAGFPVEVCTCYDAGCKTGHFRVVKGYDDSLNELLVHDPWYLTPYFGPDVHFNQQFFVGLWEPWSSCWALMTGPWRLDVEAPDQVEPGEGFEVAVTVRYPGPGPFGGQYPASNATATIQLPSGFALAGGTPTITLPAIASGDTVRVVWNVLAGASEGPQSLGFRATGIVTSWSYPAYSDSIGGTAAWPIRVGQGQAPPWTDAERLTDGSGVSSTCSPNGRSMFVEPGGVIHAVWADTKDGNSEIYYGRWDGSWGPTTRLTQDPGFSDSPVITGDGSGRLHVAWIDWRSGARHIYYKRWNGSTWSADQQLCVYNAFDSHPAIAADGLGYVHLAWEYDQSSTPRIYYRRWNGAAWSSPVELGGNPGAGATLPTIGADAAGRVSLFWEQEGPGHGPAQIYTRTYAGYWSPATALTADTTYAHGPSVAVGTDGQVHLVWSDGRGSGGDIFYRKYDGASWGPEVDLAERDGDSQYASVAAGPDNEVHVAWQDDRDGNPEVYYKYWRDEWSMDEKLTQELHSSTYPCVGVDGLGRVSLLWTDARDGNPGVYFKRRAAVTVSLSDPGVVGGDGNLIKRLYPVPMTSRATLEYLVPREGPVLLQVFDVGGRHVRTLVRESLGSGRHRAEWDGRDERGGKVSSGVFYYNLRVPGGTDSRRVVVIER
jgi:hypothetical protein